MTLLRRIGCLVLVLLIGGTAIMWSEIPRWRPGGTEPVPTPSVTWGTGLLDCPAPGGSIAIFGDSHVAGDRAGAGAVPFGRVLESRLPGRVRVTLHGVGGDTAAMGEARWLGRAAGGDLVIIAYGSNDAAPRGWLRGKAPVPVAQFSASLERQIAFWRARGSKVALLAPPPGGSAAISARLSHYRAAVAALGKAIDLPLLDPADAFAQCTAAGPVLGYDALHMTPAGHACLGAWLAERMCTPRG